MDPFQILAHDPHVVRIERATPLTLPPIDINLFRPQDRHFVTHYLPELYHILCADYIIDDFTDHAQRRRWRQHLRRTYGDDVFAYVESNPLRLNLVDALHIALTSFKEGYCGPHAAQFCALCDTNGTREKIKKYDQLSITEKLTLVNSLKEQVYTALLFLAAASTQHAANNAT